MTIEQEIQRLVDMAAPLREYEEDDPRKEPLAGIVDEINRLREMQSRMAIGIAGFGLARLADVFSDAPDSVETSGRNAVVEGSDATFHDPVGHTVKRKPGRPKKADK